MAEKSKSGEYSEQASLKSWVGYLNTGIQALVNAALAIAGLSCLFFGTRTLWENHESASSVPALTAGLVLLLAASIDRFEVLKGLGMEARTRKLDAALNKATATIEQLQELAQISGRSIVLLNAGMGRWDSAVEPRAAYEAVQQVRNNLKGLGVAEGVIREVLTPWVRSMLTDLVIELRPTMRQPIAELLEAKRIAHQSRTDLTSADYQASLDEQGRLAQLETRYLGELHTTPLGEWSSTLSLYVDAMPIAEAERQRLKSLIRPWQSRMEHLVSQSELSDREVWFDMLKPK